LKKLVAIDGNSIMNRAFYGIMNSKMLITSDGTYTNAIYGFLSILFKLLNDENPDYICVAFDLKAPTFRHKKYDQYKATRKGMPNELAMQMPIIKEILQAMNITIIEKEGYEADDILGTLANYGDSDDIKVLLLTGDKDSLQLSSNNVTIRIPTTKMGATESTDYTPDVIREKYGIEPIQFIQIKGLMGDTSDNIPGVPGVGEKTAFELIKKFHDVNTIYNLLESQEAVDGIKGKLKENLINNKDLAYLSMELGEIFREVPLDVQIGDIENKEYDNTKLYELFKRLQFRNFMDKLKLTPNESQAKLVEDKPLEIFDISSLKLDGVSELSYYFHDGLGIYCNGEAFYTSNPSDDVLKAIFKSNVLKIGYDEKKDYLFLKHKNIIPKNMMFDLTIASYVLNPSKDSYKLNDIILEETGIMAEAKKQETQIQLEGFCEINQQDNKECISKYAKYIYDCKLSLEKKLKDKEQYKLFNEMEMPLMKVLADMEYTGVLVDRKMFEDYSINLNNKVNEITKEIINIAGFEFNINSPKQLGEVLFEKLKLPVARKTKTGYSTDVDVLEHLRDEHPIIEKILEYRTLSKLKATYIDGLIPLINPETKRIHSKFNQTVTATGRISSTDPNLQNIPIRTELGRELRKIFIAPEDSLLLDADYSQIELRVLAHMANDETMIQAFNEGKDIHAITASQVFGVPLEEVTKAMRSEAKAVNFGIVYGISDFGLASNIGTSRKKAKDYIEKYFLKYPNIKKYMEDTISKCKERGYVETLFNRRRYVPEINSNNYNVRQFGERVAMNAPIQGTAADIIKIAMINIDKEFEKKNLKSKLILQVHDELVIETLKNEFEEVKNILINCMENVIKLSVPLKAEAEFGTNWFEAH
jgi:DNA polymerase-1